ncbi:pili subunit domain-containing protein [Gottschalkia acidurici 9a]|uniref:Pili subunit domain-containing protein n=1 Tax=Gottschalkia acidurici (strain ATCC 7906 / DSM 604 / BCRC 14475 / CIP 104303 / KCTC 5404 / NCIMB 10678 / 9a) TaxID=1128398 RepID=K0AWT5_GOTA9|nr:type II secretion system protein [Gottschalkia acidurici]AFS78283.1 pili subunit domain-containing protein [Gottschalkia acidurici 9a]
MSEIIKKIKNITSNQKGFTLLEMILVILIMGFLVSMVSPVVGYMTDVKRANLTKEELRNIKISIIGAEKIYDENGFIIVGGYVGDMGSLPKLYRSEWNESDNRWEWKYTLGIGAYEEINDGTGQPIGLYESKIGNDDLGEKWKGPYTTYPKDAYPNDGDNLDSVNDKELFERKNNEGKYSDAWGNTLLFYKEYEDPLDETTATLWIISRGKDQKVIIPTTLGESYDENAEENIDNIAVKIMPNEWYRSYHIGKEKKTKEKLEEIRERIIGSFDNSDEDGRKLIRGYIGDTDEWPKLYRIDESGKWDTDINGEKLEIDYLNEWGQPIALWENIGNNPNWKGPYMEYPWQGYLEDSWGNPLKFTLKVTLESEIMTITSAGYDGEFDTEDDLLININKDEWKVKDISINDEKKVKATKNILKEIEVAMLGSRDVKDASGRRIVGGYLGDMGEMPKLYKIDDTTEKWIIDKNTSEKTEIDYSKNEWGQPINLWTDNDISPVSEGFEWKGPYLTNRYDEVIKDAWGKPIKFELDTTKGKMTITSSGVDRVFGDDKKGSSDDIVTVINSEDWRKDVVTIEGIIYNNTSATKNVELEFFNTPTNSKIISVVIKPVEKDTDSDGNTLIVGGGQQKFRITTEVYFGLRKIKLTGDLEEEVEIFIGKGGTQSPTKDNLKFFIK